MTSSAGDVQYPHSVLLVTVFRRDVTSSAGDVQYPHLVLLVAVFSDQMFHTTQWYAVLILNI